MRVKVIDAVARAHHNRRPVKNSDDIVAVSRVEHQYVATSRTQIRAGTSTTAAIADHNVIRAAMPHRDLCMVFNTTRGWMTDLRVATHHCSPTSWRLACTHPRNTVDDRNAVSTVASQAQRSATCRVLPIANGGNRKGITVGKLDR